MLSTSPAGASEIVARWSAREVLLSISDDGPGIPLDVLDALGEPYVTTRNPPRQTDQGTANAPGWALAFHCQDPAGAVGGDGNLKESSASGPRRDRDRHLAPPGVFESKRQAVQGWDAQAPRTLVAAHERGIS